MFKFYLNGTEIIDHPDGWEYIASTIKRDQISGGLFYEVDMNFKTYGGQDLFIALKSAWDNDSFGISEFKIYQYSNNGYVEIHNGLIFHSDMKLALINNEISFKVEDNNWYSKIKANQRLEVSIGTTLSKNQIPIVPAPSFNLSVHKVTNGTIYANTRKAYRIYDCLKFLIAFMSDDEVGFESDSFNIGGVYQDYCIVYGHELIYHDGTQMPRLSFEKIFTDLKKRFNVRFSVVLTGTKPIIRIEPADYFFDSTNSYLLNTTPDEITLQIDTSIIYSRARIGSDLYETTSSLTFPDVQNLISFREESVHFIGVDNVDNELDLVGSLVVSNSSLEVCLEMLSGYDSYDAETFIIWYNHSTNQSYSSDWPNTGHHLYNEKLNNINTLQRWAGYIPGDVVSNFSNTVSSRFLAVNPIQQLFNVISNGIIGPIAFSDDYTLGYDTGNNYGGSTAQGTPVNAINSIFTAPVPGNCTVTSSINLIGPLGYTINIYFQKFNASNTVIDDFNGPTGTAPITQGSIFSLNATWNTYLNAGEYIAVYLNLNSAYPIPQLFCVDVNSSFSSNGMNNGNGIVLASNKDSYKCYKVNFKYPIKLADFQTIGNSKNGLISIPLNNNRSIQGWVDNIKFDNSSGDTTFSLISDGNTVYR